MRSYSVLAATLLAATVQALPTGSDKTVADGPSNVIDKREPSYSPPNPGSPWDTMPGLGYVGKRETTYSPTDTLSPWDEVGRFITK